MYAPVCAAVKIPALSETQEGVAIAHFVEKYGTSTKPKEVASKSGVDPTNSPGWVQIYKDGVAVGLSLRPETDGDGALSSADTAELAKWRLSFKTPAIMESWGKKVDSEKRTAAQALRTLERNVKNVLNTSDYSEGGMRDALIHLAPPANAMHDLVDRELGSLDEDELKHFIDTTRPHYIQKANEKKASREKSETLTGKGASDAWQMSHTPGSGHSSAEQNEALAALKRDADAPLIAAYPDFTERSAAADHLDQLQINVDDKKTDAVQNLQDANDAVMQKARLAILGDNVYQDHAANYEKKPTKTPAISSEKDAYTELTTLS